MPINPGDGLSSDQGIVDGFFRGFNRAGEQVIQWSNPRGCLSLNQGTHHDLRFGPDRDNVACGEGHDDLTTGVSGCRAGTGQPQCGSLCQAFALPCVEWRICSQNDDTTALIRL